MCVWSVVIDGMYGSRMRNDRGQEQALSNRWGLCFLGGRYE